MNMNMQMNMQMKMNTQMHMQMNKRTMSCLYTQATRDYLSGNVGIVFAVAIHIVGVNVIAARNVVQHL